MLLEFEFLLLLLKLLPGGETTRVESVPDFASHPSSQGHKLEPFPDAPILAYKEFEEEDPEAENICVSSKKVDIWIVRSPPLSLDDSVVDGLRAGVLGLGLL